jgi:hypothetical protein
MATFGGGTVSGDIFPAITGQDLGSPTQRWDAFLQSLDVNLDTQIAGDLNVDGTATFAHVNLPALTGPILITTDVTEAIKLVNTAQVDGITVVPDVDGETEIAFGVRNAADALWTAYIDKSGNIVGSAATLTGALSVTGNTILTGQLTATSTCSFSTTLISGSMSVTGTAYLVDVIGSYNGVNTAGSGVATIRSAATLTSRSTSLGSTHLITSARAGLYRVDYTVEVIQAATTSSSIQVALGWNNGAAMSYLGTAKTGNTTTTYDQGSVVIRSAGSQAIDYATTYTSSGAVAMLYDLTIRVEEL